MLSDKKLKKIKRWANAESCETGEVMLKMLQVLSFSDYVPQWYLKATAQALVEMQAQLQADFKIDEDGDMESR